MYAIGKNYKDIDLKYTKKLTNVDEILELRHKILRNGFPIHEVMFDEDNIHTTRHYAFFNETAKAIACLTLMKADWEDKSIWRLRAMAVEENFQGNGLGIALLEHALNDLENKNLMDDIWLHARTTSESFYEKFNFQRASDIFEFGNAGPSIKMLRKF